MHYRGLFQPPEVLHRVHHVLRMNSEPFHVVPDPLIFFICAFSSFVYPARDLTYVPAFSPAIRPLLQAKPRVEPQSE